MCVWVGSGSFASADACSGWGWGWGCGCRLGLPPRRLRGFAEPGGGSASYPEREGACRLRLRAAVWTPWVLGWGAPATVNTDSAAGACLRMLFLLSAQPWSTLAAGNTCEYSKSFKTYTVNWEFVFLKKTNWILQMESLVCFWKWGI